MEEKNKISQVWVDLFVDCEKVPENIENLSNADMREWLFQTLMHDTKRLLFEWDLAPDEKQIGNIVRESDPIQKAQLEKEYILEMHRRFTEKIATFDSAGKSSMWSSWPKEMRAQGLCNCVGASTLGIEILESAGITSYYGNPVGHVVNVVRLSDGKWWYVDFLNGSSQCKEIDVQEILINDMHVLKIDDAAIDYRLIIYGDNDNMPAYIASNIVGMDHEVDDMDLPDNNVDKIYAKKYLAKNKDKMLPENEMNAILKKLYPDMNKKYGSPEMDAERIRIRELYGTEGEDALSFMRSLTDHEEKELLHEISQNVDLIEKLLRDNDPAVYQTASKNTTEFLQRLTKEVNKAGEISEDKKMIKINAVIEKINDYKNESQK